MTADKLLIKAEGVNLALKNQQILKDVSFSVSRGEIVTIIGPNGAGKTTLFRILLGLVPASSGWIWRAPTLKIGYMPQKLQITPTLPLSVNRFLKLGIKKPLQTSIESSLQAVGAAALGDRSLHVLSGGEIQRVLLARAILNQPDLLILDEPVQGVDINGQQVLYQLISQLRDKLHCGVLLVSHDLHLVLASSDQVLCLNQHVCCAGKPEKIVFDPQYTALFGTKGIASLAFYTHHHDHTHDVSLDVPSADESTPHG